MPKSTFFNLPEEKRNHIFAVAMRNFAQKPYHLVKVTQIIEECGMARGSFYQYFEDKLDLYDYILSTLSQLKISYLQKRLPKQVEKDFFAELRSYYRAGLEFANDFPEFTRIGYWLMRDTSGLKSKLGIDDESRAVGFFKQLLTDGIERKEIDPTIDVPFTAYLLVHINSALMEYYLTVLEPEPEESSGEVLLQYVDRMLNILKTGLARKEV